MDKSRRNGSSLSVAGLAILLTSCAQSPGIGPDNREVVTSEDKPFVQTVANQGLANPESESTVEGVIEQADRYYQDLFKDETLTSKGIFGANRIISSKIDAHGASNTDPIYRNRDIKSEVFVYGNKGKPLDPSSLKIRFHRLQNSIDYEGTIPGVREGKRLPPHGFSIDTLIQAAAKESLQGAAGPFIHESNGWTLQIRRVNLSKRECLSCHSGQKFGDPVALMAYLAIKAPRN